MGEEAMPAMNIETPSRLKLLLDSAEVSEWQRLLPSGLFYGVTTNPKLVRQAGLPYTLETLAELARRAFDLGAGEIHLQTWGTEVNEMLERGRKLAALDRRVMVKVPATREGLYCAHALVEGNASVTLTAMYAAHQVLAAAALGVRYAVPYLGRMNESGLDGLREVAAMQEMLDHLAGPTQVLVASIRKLDDLVALARRGVQVFTLLPPLVDDLLDEPQSQKAAADFDEYARSTG
jgi:transaldolase